MGVLGLEQGCWAVDCFSIEGQEGEEVVVEYTSGVGRGLQNRCVELPSAKHQWYRRTR